VVIAIIAILAAILFPVFAQARESARQTACLSNQKQLGTGLMMYAQDYDETLPAWPFSSKKGGVFNDPRFTVWGYSLWVDAVMPYVKNRAVFACPNGPRLNRWSNWPNASLTGPLNDPFVVNLAINEYVENWDNGYAPLASSPGRRMDRRRSRSSPNRRSPASTTIGTTVSAWRIGRRTLAWP